MGRLGRTSCPRTSARRPRPTRRWTTRSRAPNVEGIEAMLEAAGIKTVYRETYAIDTKNFDASPAR